MTPVACDDRDLCHLPGMVDRPGTGPQGFVASPPRIRTPWYAKQSSTRLDPQRGSDPHPGQAIDSDLPCLFG